MFLLSLSCMFFFSCVCYCSWICFCSLFYFLLFFISDFISCCVWLKKICIYIFFSFRFSDFCFIFTIFHFSVHYIHLFLVSPFQFFYSSSSFQFRVIAWFYCMIFFCLLCLCLNCSSPPFFSFTPFSYLVVYLAEFHTCLFYMFSYISFFPSVIIYISFSFPFCFTGVLFHFINIYFLPQLTGFPFKLIYFHSFSFFLMVSFY